MSEHVQEQSSEAPTKATEEAQRSTSKPPRNWKPWAIPAAALLIGVGIGGAAGGTDPTQSEEYQALEQRMEEEGDDAQRRITALSDQSREAQSAAREAQEANAQRAAELDERERALKAREDAVTATEERIAATSIGHGVWTVGVDVEPGTYRTAQALTGYCYWGIYRSGTNGSDIVDNDGPEGGYPTVTLSVGQDFENSGCGTFVKQ